MSRPKILLFNIFGPIFSTQDNRQGLLYTLSKHMCRLFEGTNDERNGLQPVLQISSRGGSLEEALQVYAYLSQIPQELITFGVGLVESAAALIYLAGKKRLATPTTLFSIHGGTYSIARANYSEVQSMAKHHALQTKIQAKIIAKITNVSLAQAQRWMLEGKSFSVKEAKSYGIVHEIVERFPFAEDDVILTWAK